MTGIAYLAVIFALLTGLCVGVTFAKFLKSFLPRDKNNDRAEGLSLLNNIERVIKLVTVEGRFSHIMKHTHDKPLFLNIQSTKKALVIVNATVLIGFNLKEFYAEINHLTKTLTIYKLPKPEILSFDPDYEFYDIKEATFNKYSPEEHTKLIRDARSQVMELVNKSELLKIAEGQKDELLKNIQKAASGIGWFLEYGSDVIQNNLSTITIVDEKIKRLKV